MRAFEISLNGERLCVAGIGENGVLNTMITQVIGTDRNDLSLRTGGLISSTQEHVVWTPTSLNVGDEVFVRIIETETVDPPSPVR